MMPSLSCRTAIKRRRRGRSVRARSGFTLIELIIVVVLIGGIAAVVAGSLVGRSLGAERRRAVGELVAGLATARVEAIRSGRAVSAEAEFDGVQLKLDVEGRSTHWPARGLRLMDDSGRRLERSRVRFQASGRADAREWIIAAEPASIGGSPGRIWRIEFDPVSGAAMLRNQDEPSRAGVVEEVVR